jgi:hypothetical protein
MAPAQAATLINRLRALISVTQVIGTLARLSFHMMAQCASIYSHCDGHVEDVVPCLASTRSMERTVPGPIDERICSYSTGCGFSCSKSEWVCAE